MDADLLLILAGLIAVFSSFVGAFAGGGSSLILLAFLLQLFPESYLSELAVVKVSGFILVLTSSSIHIKKTQLDFTFLWVLTLTGILGTALGTYVLQFYLPEDFLRRFLGVVMLIVVVYLIFSRPLGLTSRGKVPFSFKENVLGGWVSFFFSALNSISGGLGMVMGSYLACVHRISYLEASAYNAVSAILVLGLQAAYLTSQVNLNFPLLSSVILGSIVGSYLGTHSQYLKGNTWIKGAATIVLLVLGINMFL